MPASPELLERVLQDPEHASPMDRLIVGLATIAAIQESSTPEDEDRAMTLNTSSALTAGALNELRLNPETNEAQKLFLVSKVMSEVNFQELPQSKESFRLLATTIFTLAGGVETRINERPEELRNGLNRSFMELTEALLYGEIKDELTPREKIVYLYETFGNFSLEERRQIAILRACQFATDPDVDDEAFGDMIRFFSEKGDQEALAEVSVAKLKSIMISDPA